MTTLPTVGRAAEIDTFLEKIKPGRHSMSTGRLIFALDATVSRQPTWDQACAIQGEMFEATASLGRLDIQLMFYRGFDECKASRWLTSAAELHHAMRRVSCVGGQTQIGRVLDHAIRETQKAKVNGLVFVGDAMEERVDHLCRLAGELGRLGTPIFLFHETPGPAIVTGLPSGAPPEAWGAAQRLISASHGIASGESLAAFQQLASLSHGACLSFDLASIGRFKELLAAIAVFAAGGYQALESYAAKQGGEVLQLTSQLRGS
jgi:hypothetical protein